MNSPAPPGTSPPSPLASAPALVQALASPTLWKTVGVGALAGLAGFLASEPLYSLVSDSASRASRGDIGAAIAHVLAVSATWVGIIGTIIGMALLAWENLSSLRGAWFRDMGPGLPLFAVLGLVAGAASQFIYSIGMAVLFAGSGSAGNIQTSTGVLLGASLVRGAGWALFGAGVGAPIGILRGDHGQSLRGALGGALGGFIGGVLFNFVAIVGGASADWIPRLIGIVLLGAFIGGAARLIQETLRSAWLLGISTGPYEGKEYPLGKARLSVGRGSGCDLSLFRDESLAPQVGAFVFQNNTWWWQGEPVAINGVPQTNAPLQPGARLQIGQTLFRFNDRSKNAPRDPLAPPVITGGSVMSGNSPSAAPLPVQSPAPVPAPALAWTFSPSIGNTLTGFRLGTETGTATIGRATGNTWVLADDGTSSRHARLERTFEGLAITDLGSTNGTFLNGQQIAPNVPVALRGGETLRIGRTQWMVRRGG